MYIYIYIYIRQGAPQAARRRRPVDSQRSEVQKKVAFDDGAWSRIYVYIYIYIYIYRERERDR